MSASSSSSLLFALLYFLTLLTSGQTRYRFERPSRVVEIKHGRLQGTLIEVPLITPDQQQSQVEIFRGIPFAAPPVGSLRFMPPVTVTPWREIRSATQFGPVCPQMMPDTRNESAALSTMSKGRLQAIRDMKPLLSNQTEDCLYLNVYTPGGSKSRSKGSSKGLNPVILFIHGDSYEWGSGNVYDGSVLAAVGKVVVVTLNYRLGILGFLNANTDGKSRHPSNLGILDQIAALHWVQENIANFGGDPRNVTLMGHGTGAACVHFLMTSEALPEGKLFHRVILMSGSALSPWAVVNDPARATLQVAVSLNCTEEQLLQRQKQKHGRVHQDVSLLQCLRSVPLYQLMRASKPSALEPFRTTSHHQMPRSSQPFRSTWGPSYDGVVVHSFRRRMRDYLERMARYELLFGVATSDSAFAFNDRQLEYGLESEERNRIFSEFVSSNYGLHQREIFASIVTEYTDWQSATQHPVNIRDKTLEALTDAHYVAPLVETGDYHSSLNSRSWFYVFDYQTKNSYYKQRGGCVHGEELNYVFGSPLQREAREVLEQQQQQQKQSSQAPLPASVMGAFGGNFSRSEALLAMNVIHFWSNFAATGDPNLSRQYDQRPRDEEWESYDPKYKKYISIGPKPRMRDHYRPQKMALWLNLIPDLQSAAVANQARAGSTSGKVITPNNDDKEPLLDYRLYNELLPFVPKLKNLDTSTLEGSTPASSEVLDLHGRSNTTPDGQANVMKDFNNNNGQQAKQNNASNSYIVQQDSANGSLSSYSTALSVTIAIGCSLLVLNVLIFTAVYYQRDRNREHNNKLDDTLMTCKLQDHHQRHLDPGGMTSISQYIERRPSDPNCLLQQNSPPPLLDYQNKSSRRSLQDVPPPPPPLVVNATTVSVGGPPRKSALKNKSAENQQPPPSTFRTHLPPPEFADKMPPSPNRHSTHLTMAEAHGPSRQQHSSFRTLPRPVAQQQAHHMAQQPLLPPLHNSSQTLPLKSNLKKSSGPNNNGSNNKATLQWNTSASTDQTVVARASLEELRV